MTAVLSNEQVATIWPNSGCAQVTFHTEPEWDFQEAEFFQVLVDGSRSQIFTCWSEEQVAEISKRVFHFKICELHETASRNIVVLIVSTTLHRPLCSK